jgi:ergot alkaloid biosynthesis protein
MAREKVLVTGGTGKTGGKLARRLLEEGRSVRIASRSGGSLDGAESAAFDWSDEGTHDAALVSVDRIYLVAPVGVADVHTPMARFIDRALVKGVRRFVLLSASSIEEGGAAMGTVHRYLRSHAPEWAVLRPSWFMQNFSEGQHQPTIRDEGLIYSATADGRVPFIDAADIAECALRTLCDPQSHDCAYILTGPEALSYAEAAAIIGEAAGHEVAHRRLTTAELAQRWEEAGVEPAYAAILAGMDEAIANGSEDRTADSVLQITGRAPRNLADFAQCNAGAWKK